MKKTLTIAVLITLTLGNLNAQFGLDKIKKKVENAESKKKEENTKEVKTDSQKPNSATESEAKLSDEQKNLEDGIDYYYQRIQGYNTYDMMNSLKKENKTTVNFENLSKKYNSLTTKSDAVLKHIERVEEFYTKMATKELPVTESDVNRIFTRANANEYNGNSLELKGVKQEKWKVYPNYVIEDITKILPDLNDQRDYLYKDKTKINELIKKCEDEKMRLEAYSKADYSKFKADYDKAFLGTILLNPAGMNDPEITNFIKTKFDVKYGKVIKAVIVDTKWFIDKTNAGIPKYKYTTFNASVKKADGTCQKHWGRVVMQYEGGGKYGEKYLTYQDSREMTCENANK